MGLRKTNLRPDDNAYCLMGLFEVNMPMLYDEGERAFIRWQEEIMRYSDDQLIFAWRSKPLNETVNGTNVYCRLRATRPESFSESGSIVPLSQLGFRYIVHNDESGTPIEFVPNSCC